MMWTEKRRIMERYDQFVDSYSELHLEEQMAKYTVALENIELRSEDVVADFGCGIGIFLKLVAKSAKKAVGIDLSREELRIARDEHLENVSLIQSDIDHPPFKYKAFDHVFSFTVLHHTEKLDKEIDHLSRYSKKGIVVGILKRTEAECQISNLTEKKRGVMRIGVHFTKDVLLKIDTKSSSRT